MLLKVPLIIIMKRGENIILRPKYIDIYEFRGGTRGMYMVHRTFFVYYYKKKTKKYKSMTYT